MELTVSWWGLNERKEHKKKDLLWWTVPLLPKLLMAWEKTKNFSLKKKVVIKVHSRLSWWRNVLIKCQTATLTERTNEGRKENRRGYSITKSKAKKDREKEESKKKKTSKNLLNRKWHRNEVNESMDSYQ